MSEGAEKTKRGQLHTAIRHPLSIFLALVLVGLFGAALFGLWTNSNCSKFYQPSTVHQATGQKNQYPTINTTAPVYLIDRGYAQDPSQNARKNSESSEQQSWGSEFLCEIKVSDLVTIWLTWCLVIVGGMQAWWLYGTLAATAKAANTAERALIELERPFVIAEISKVIASRGNVAFYHNNQMRAPTLGFGHVTLAFANFGRTPASMSFVHYEYLPAASGGIPDRSTHNLFADGNCQ
jgi:hypothetical protein